jgi:hypothetical protein
MGIAIFASLAGSARADASESSAPLQARHAYERGREHFDAGEFGQAIVEFRAAYAATRAPGLLYNLAQAYRLEGDCAEALRLYRAFVASEPRGKVRELADARVAELAPCDGTEPSDSALANTNASNGAALPGSPFAAEPQLRVVPTPRLEALQLSPEQLASFRSADDALRNASPTRATPPYARAAIGFGSALALFSVSGYFGYRASAASSEVSQLYAERGSWSADAAATERQGMRDEKIALAAGAAGLVATGITTWLLTWD